ncbi:hypothetical protein BCM02_10717 [Paenibacillus methanolicus]|uniref:Uncharacterized protein n=1 Tax=Paenibacillus methanolicus TaxID=582686 RepID=A0A5S5C4Z0_9BACL|nr:hypothetical protein BCM02_10717 [Paenibacillus methanolicus]
MKNKKESRSFLLNGMLGQSGLGGQLGKGSPLQSMFMGQKSPWQGAPMGQKPPWSGGPWGPYPW